MYRVSITLSATLASLAVLLAGTASAASPEIRTGKESYAEKEPITVHFQNVPGDKKDGITIVPADTPVNRYRQWRRLGGATQGTAKFRGLKTGRYEARLFLKGKRDEVASSAQFLVGEVGAQTGASRARKEAPPSPDDKSVRPRIVAERSVYGPNEEIVAEFSGAPGNSHDWIAVAKHGASVRQHLRTAYLRGAINGKQPFEGLEPGEYELRLHANGDFNVIASARFSVAPGTSAATDARADGPPRLRVEKSVFGPHEKIVVHFERLPGNRRDTVVVRKREDPPGSGGPYYRTRGETSGTFTFSRLPPGAYEARLHLDGKPRIAAFQPFVVSTVSLFVPPAVEPGQTGQLGKAGTVEAQCEVLRRWSERVDEEFPEFKPAKHRHPRHEIWVTNLFRDEVYRPVFGRNYADTDAEAGDQLLALIGLCRRFGTDEAKETLRRYNSWYAIAFRDRYARSRKAALAERLQKARSARAWIESVSQELRELGSSADDWQRVLQIGERLEDETTVEVYRRERVPLLWPGELRSFSALFEARKSAVAIAFARSALSSLPPEIESLRKIDEALQAARPHVVAADKDTFASLGPLADRRRLEIYERAIAALPSEPSSLEKLSSLMADARTYELAARHEERFERLTRVAEGVRAKISAGAVQAEIAGLAALPDEPRSLLRIDDRRRFLAELLQGRREAVEIAEFDEAATRRKREILEVALRRFRDELEALPATLEGAKAALAAADRQFRNAELLGAAYRAPFEEAGSHRAQAIFSVLIADSQKKLFGKRIDWRSAPDLVARAEQLSARFEGTPAAQAASALVTRSLEVATAAVEQGLSSFSAELGRLDDWSGLEQASAIHANLSRRVGMIGAYASYLEALERRKEVITKSLEVAAFSQIAGLGSSYRDIDGIIEISETLARRFEQAGLASFRPALRKAAEERIQKVLEEGIGAYTSELAAVKPSYASVAALEDQGAEFAGVAGAMPAFGAYRDAATARAKEIESDLCADLLNELRVANNQEKELLLGAGGAMTFQSLACRAHRNGYKVSLPAQGADSGFAKMTVLQADGDFVHLKLHRVEARPGQKMLVGKALGDANGLDPISVEEWEAYVASLVRERYSGVPDAQGVTACDRLAADVNDPQRLTPGVVDDELDAEAALQACTEALEYEPQNTRLQFQFARTLLAAGAVEDATGVFKAAAEAGYAAAAGYFADILFADPEQGDAGLRAAKPYYQRAARGGFKPAQDVLQELKAAAVTGGVSADTAPQAYGKPEGPTEKEMLGALVGAVRKQYGCDIVKGCNIMGGILSMRVTSFKKLDCSPLSSAEFLCTYVAQMKCNSSFGGVHDRLSAAMCNDGGGPTKKSFIRDGDRWLAMN